MSLNGSFISVPAPVFLESSRFTSSASTFKSPLSIVLLNLLPYLVLVVPVAGVPTCAFCIFISPA